MFGLRKTRGTFPMHSALKLIALLAAVLLGTVRLHAQEGGTVGTGRGAEGSTSSSASVEALQREMAELRASMERQRVGFEQQLAVVNGRLEQHNLAQLGAELEGAVNAALAATPTDRDGRLLLLRSGPGQGSLAISGLMRMRFEGRARNVDFNSAGHDDSGTRFDGRMRLGFEADVAEGGDGTPRVTARADLQVAGRFANNTAFDFAGPNTVALPAQFSFFDTPFETVMLYQGYAELGDLLGSGSVLRFGRQEFIRGSQFLLGNSDFNSGLAHDGVVLSWDNAADDFNISTFMFTEAQSDGTLMVTNPAEDMNDDVFAGVYTTLVPTENMVLDLYALRFHGRSGATDSFVTMSSATAFDGAWVPALRGRFWTFGGRAAFSGLDFAGGKLALSAEGAWQDGSRSLDPLSSGGLTTQDIRGFGAELAANWWINPGSATNPIFSLGFYNASGGRSNGGTANGWPAARMGFQPLFMNRHFAGGDRNDIHAPYFAGGGRYGNLDLIPLDNMEVFKVAFSVAAADNVELGLAWNAAWIADDVGFGTGYFGSELDLFSTWSSTDSVQISADVSLFFPSAGATNQANWMFFAPGGGAGDQTAFGCWVQALVTF